MKFRLLVVWMFIACAVLIHGQTPTPDSELDILSPADGATVSGTVWIRAAVRRSESAPASVTFFVDGRQLCSTATAPFECYWDAGPQIAEHQIRVVATFANGQPRAVKSIRTGLPAPVAAGTPMFSTHVDAVELAVSVSDGGERFTDSLPQSAFHVFEDGVPQTLSSFASRSVPIELVVAVDISGSMTLAMPKLKLAVKEFLENVPSPNSTTVLAFNDRIVQIATPATSAAERAAAVDRLEAYGATTLYDVIVRAIDLVEPKAGRKAVIVFTDGEDQGSRTALTEVEGRLQTSDVTLYMIGQGRGVQFEDLQKIMRRLVQPTGGRALFTNKIDDLREAFKSLLSEISHQYLLAYIPTDTRRDNRWRRIRVDVDGHHQVRTREGYRLLPQ
jgi:Ca-activated chloride channel family protein